MPESPRERRRSHARNLSRLACLGFAVLLVVAGGAVGCKKQPVTTEPAQEPSEPAVADDSVNRDTRPDSGRTTEVDDGGFQTEGLNDDDVDSGELSPDDVANIVQEQLRTVFFSYDQSELSETTRRVLETNAKVLSLNPGVNVIVEGHCDERGTIEYNLALGQRRAESVRDYLINLGVEADRLRTVSYGEERPVDTGGTESAWSRNRRAAFVVE